ncbi:hypothetical protein ScPMuIL_012052 [Solemya velum]
MDGQSTRRTATPIGTRESHWSTALHRSATSKLHATNFCLKNDEFEAVEKVKMKSEPIVHLLDTVDSTMTLGSEKRDRSEKQLNIKLEEKDLWEKFKEYTNEMIVTKSGRRMFPVFKASVSGLDANSMYTLVLDFEQVDSHRWKYVNGEWVAGGKAEPPAPNSVYVHPDSPNFGAHWMKDIVSFSKVKLTNKLNSGGQIMLNSLHKYEPRIHVVKVNANAQKKALCTFNFPETQFIAVTAYQNEEITALKIKHNPFAKAFLDAKERPDQRDFIEETLESQQRSLSQLTGTWYIPSGGPSLVPPPAHHHHQIPNALNLSNPTCDRLSLRNARASPYPNPYQRRASQTGNYAREVPTNMHPVLNIADSWGHMPSPSHSMLPGNSSGSQSQYGMWMAGPVPNLPTNQSCDMSYLRSTTPYSLPTSTSVSNLSPISATSSMPSFDHYDFSCFTGSAMPRDLPRNNCWNPLSPSPV